MPPIASANGVDPTAMESLAQSGGPRGGAGAPGSQASPDQIRAKIEQAVGQIREYSAKLDELGKSIPGSEKLITQMKSQLRQLAGMAAQAGATQNSSADALPS